VAPVAGEALDSWLEAHARRLSVTTAAFMAFLGLRGSRPQLMVGRLTGHERDVLSRRGGLDPHELSAMTLEPFNGSVVNIKPGRQTMSRPTAWRFYGNHSRYCPACLDQDPDRWQLTWRLPWSFACPHHRRLLLDRCLLCGRRPRVCDHARRPGPPQPDPADNPAPRDNLDRSSFRCGHRLADSPTTVLPPDGLVLAAHYEVIRRVLGADHASSTARQHGQELHALARRALDAVHTHRPAAPGIVHDVLTECGGFLPARTAHLDNNDAHNAAVGTTLAVIAADTQHPACQEVFAWLLDSDPPRTSRTDSRIRQIRRWAPAGPRVLTRMIAATGTGLTLAASLRYGATTPEPALPALGEDDIRRRAAKLPAMLWPTWTRHVLPPETPPTAAVAGFRRACASLMLLPGSNLDHPQAALMLGNRFHRRNRTALDAVTDPYHLAAALVMLARALDGHDVPIDYQRRRAIFHAHDLRFDLDAHRELCRRHGRVNHYPVHIKRLRWHVLRLLLGADPGAASHTPTWQPQFQYRLTPELHEFLTSQATANLAAHGIDEPICWEPPAHWLDGPQMPVDPRKVEPTDLASLTLQGLQLPEAAHRLGLDKHHLNLHLESAGTVSPRPPPQRPRTRGVRVPRQGPLEPERLRDLYHKQRLPLEHIAELARCSSATVRQSLAEAGIPLSPKPLPGVLERSLSRAWLETEYHTKGRGSRDIARELGVDKSTITRLLTTWGIPLHAKGQFPSPFAHLDVTLSPAMTAMSRSRNCLRWLANLLSLPGKADLATASAALGISVATSSYQVTRTAQIVGFTVIDGPEPLTATAPGRAFLREAEHLLDLLNHHTP
jgi:hypothetical protein